MSDDQIYTLVPSSTTGRYALDDSEHGADVTSGCPLEILLNGQWISGKAEHGHELYVNVGLQFLGDKPHLPERIDGYYFLTDNGICGLCVGMKVRLA